MVAGSGAYPGAAVLACQGALAAGVGMVRYLGPPDVADLVRRSCPEVVCSAGHRGRNARSGLARWPGLDDSDEEQLQRARDAADSGLPTIADAGALPALPDVLAPQVILTPHAGELAALLQRLGAALDRSAVEASTLSAVRRAAGLTEATVLLKGATTLVASPYQDFYSQAEGTPWLATAGSGDVLAGVIGALLAQLGADVGRFGALWHRSRRQMGGDRGDGGQHPRPRRSTPASHGGPLTATAIADAVPEVMREL